MQKLCPHVGPIGGGDHMMHMTVMANMRESAEFNWSFEQEWIDDQKEHEALLLEDRLAGRRPSPDARKIPSVTGWMKSQNIPAPINDEPPVCDCGICRYAEYGFYLDEYSFDGDRDISYAGKSNVQKELWLLGAPVDLVANPYGMEFR